MNRLRMHEIKVVNRREIDVHIRDAFGKMHTLFPRAEKTITILTEAGGGRKVCRPESNTAKTTDATIGD